MSLFVHVTVTLRAVQIIGGKENYFVVTGVILCIILNITYSENFGQCLWNHLVILYIYISQVYWWMQCWINRFSFPSSSNSHLGFDFVWSWQCFRSFDILNHYSQIKVLVNQRNGQRKDKECASIASYRWQHRWLESPAPSVLLSYLSFYYKFFDLSI